MAVATEAGVDFDVVLYMSDRVDRGTLRGIVERLEDPVENLVRRDSQFSKLELDPDDYAGNPDAVVDVLLKYPRLMQRPVLVRGDRAIIGRPLGDMKAKDRLAEFLGPSGP